MKKKRMVVPFSRRGMKLILRKMKLTVLFSFLLVVTSWDTTLSQTVKLRFELRNVPVQQLIQEIEEQTEFYFLYQDEVFKKDQTVTVLAKETSVESILQQLAEQASVQYQSSTGRSYFFR